MEKISIIVPIYNVENYVAKCLDSILRQSYTQVEVLCVDDCGSDASMAIVENYAQKHSNIQILRHTHNQGLGAARNTGLDAASGEYVFFLDSDDLLGFDALEQLYATMQKDKVDFVVAKTQLVVEDIHDAALEKRKASLEKYLYFEPFACVQVCADTFSENISTLSSIACGRLFSRKFIENNSLRFVQEKFLHEDEGFLLKVLSCYPRYSGIAGVGIQYVLRKGSITNNSNQTAQNKRKHVLAVIDDALQYIAQRVDEKQYDFFKNSIVFSDKYTPFFQKVFFNVVLILASDTKMHVRIFQRTFLDIIHSKFFFECKFFGRFVVYAKRKT